MHQKLRNVVSQSNSRKSKRSLRTRAQFNITNHTYSKHFRIKSRNNGSKDLSATLKTSDPLFLDLSATLKTSDPLKSRNNGSLVFKVADKSFDKGLRFFPFEFVKFLGVPFESET